MPRWKLKPTIGERAGDRCRSAELHGGRRRCRIELTRRSRTPTSSVTRLKNSATPAACRAGSHGADDGPDQRDQQQEDEEVHIVSWELPVVSRQLP